MPITTVGERIELEEQNLDTLLRTITREGELHEKLPENKVRCYACGHRCPIPDGRAGVCRVRFNIGGKLLVPHGYVGALQLDPIEKKPFFHALPGALALHLRHARLRLSLLVLPELGHIADAA